MTSDLIIYRAVLRQSEVNEVLNVQFHVGFALSGYRSVNRQDAVHALLDLYGHTFKHIPTSQQIHNHLRFFRSPWTHKWQ